MSQKFPTDEFDFVGGIGGRHRARRGKRDSFFELLQVMIVGVVISGGGYLGLQVLAKSGNLPIDPGVVVAVKPNQFTKGGGVGVSVIDASNETDAASKLGQKLLDDGWNVWSASRSINKARKPGHVKKTIVYASGDSSADAAKSLAKTLGGYTSIVSTKYADPITIVLGTDYNN